MAYLCRPVPERHCILVKWSGRFRPEELWEVVRSYSAMDIFHDGACVLHDARDWDLNVPTAELLRVAQHPVILPARHRGPRLAAFVVSDALAYGMIQVLVTLRARPDLRLAVFRDVDEAKTWLGLGTMPGDPFAGIAPLQTGG